MGNLARLAADIDKAKLEIRVVGNEKAKRAATIILNDLTMVTPADTGTALSNWQVSLGELPSNPPVSAHVPSPRGKMVGGVWTHAVDPAITVAANAPATREAAAAYIEAKSPGEPLWITSDVPYMGKLEQNGTSKQAPAGFVDRAIMMAKLLG
jgi:hypothetical protein